jgi:general secretion pathway protein K
MNFRFSISSSRRSAKIPRANRASVLVIVMITLLFATFALVAFMEKASVDMIVDQRDILTRRLRMEAYSALEVTLGVLNDFREVNQGLRSPSEGWDNPLDFAQYTPAEDRKVEIAFEDESGKISLPRANPQVLTNLFLNWGIAKGDAEMLADAMGGWMQRNHVYTTTVTPNYEGSAIPYDEPGRSLRSLQELLAIEKVRDFFFDSDGRPNEYWKRFAESVSLLDFPRPSINGAKPDTLAALGRFDENQQRSLSDYRDGTGQFQGQGRQIFQNPADAQRIAGPTGDANAFSPTISALRITVTVRDGHTEYKLSTVIAPPGGATSVQTTATSTRTQASAASANSGQPNRPNTTQPNPRPPTASQQNPNPRNLKYPFTLLEMRENDEIPAAPAPAGGQ